MGLGVSETTSVVCKIIFCLALIIPVVILSVFRFKGCISRKQFWKFVFYPLAGSIAGALLLLIIQLGTYIL